jgi:hypothetical protein
MQRKERSEPSELEDQIASLEAELVAIAFWDEDYLNSSHHSLIDTSAFDGRQLRVKQVISELKLLKRRPPVQVVCGLPLVLRKVATDQPVLNKKNVIVLSVAKRESYRLRPPKLPRT